MFKQSATLLFVCLFLCLFCACANEGRYNLHRRHTPKLDAFLRKERAKHDIANKQPIAKEKPAAKRGYWGEPL